MGDVDSVMTPSGVELKAGQTWRDLDPRGSRVFVIDFICRGGEYVRLKGERSTQAAVRRFTGKRGGYEFVK